MRSVEGAEGFPILVPYIIYMHVGAYVKTFPGCLTFLGVAWYQIKLFVGISPDINCLPCGTRYFLNNTDS